MQTDEDTSSSSLCLHQCFACGRNTLTYFECSRLGCPGPRPPASDGSIPAGSHCRRIALCDACAVRCPFCAHTVQQEDLRSVTDKPATLLTCSGDDRDPVQCADGAAAPREIDHDTLDQFNLHLQELADKVQKRMRELRRDLATSEHPEIASLVEEAKTLFHSLAGRGLRPDRITYQWFLSVFARAKDREQLEKWAYEMEQSDQCSTEAYNSVMFGFAMPHGVDRADMWFNRMLKNGVAPDAKSYTILIQACAVSRDSTRANRCFQRMQVAGIMPNVVTFSHLISACAYEDDDPHSLEKAEGFWKSMEQAGVRPNNFTFMRLLKACANAGNPRRAAYFFNRSVEAGFVPNVVTYTSMISVFIKKGDVRGAEEWFGNMQAADVRPDVTAFNCVMSVCGAAGDVRNARKWLERLEAAGFQPTEHTYEALISSVLAHQDFAQADAWLQRMLDSGVTRTIKAFHILLKACERTGDLHQAEEWFSSMTHAGVQPDASAYNSMLKTSAAYDSSVWRRMRRQVCQEQRKWFLRMTRSGVQPNEDTHDILTRSSSFPVSAFVLMILAGASLSVLLRRQAAAR